VPIGLNIAQDEGIVGIPAYSLEEEQCGKCASDAVS
jgi:hypothetical protein